MNMYKLKFPHCMIFQVDLYTCPHSHTKTQRIKPEKTILLTSQRFFFSFLTSGNLAQLLYPPDPPPFASHSFLAIASRPVPQRARADLSDLSSSSLWLPGSGAGFAHTCTPTHKRDIRGEPCFRPGHRWAVRLSEKNTKLSAGDEPSDYSQLCLFALFLCD